MQEKYFWKKLVRNHSVLNPIDRISEVLFGLIMVLTFTGAIAVTTQNKQEISELLWAALGCNIAWGFVDAVMYLMNLVIERGHAIKVIKQIKNTSNDAQRVNMLKEEMQPLISDLIKNEELNHIAEKIKHLPEPDKRLLLHTGDLISGVQIFLLVFLCTFPVALPFIFIHEVALATRISNLVSLLLLFTGGFILAKYAGFRPVITALLYTFIGILLVALTMSLGG